jgi:flagellin
MTGTALAAGHDWSAANAQSFRLSLDGGTTWSNDITLNTNTTSAATMLSAVQAALTAASVTGVTASLDNNKLVLTSDTKGATSKIQVEGPSTGNSALTTLGFTTAKVSADANIGFGVSGSSFTAGNLATSTAKNYSIDAGGASSAKNVVSGNSLSFTALKYGNDSQAITISGNSAGGVQTSTTITLKNIVDGSDPTANRAGRDIDSAISYINTQLQKTNDSTLQKIVAVKENKAGVDQINFISPLSSFNVSVASTANADGINGGVSENVNAAVVGEGANMQVDTREGAIAAISAITNAVSKLGSAQAAVGKGQNQLTYAVSLAQSQITNFSSAEAQIRDANVAQQAANLSKAQVLTQASIAAMAQANSAPQAVLSLLRG